MAGLKRETSAAGRCSGPTMTWSAPNLLLRRIRATFRRSSALAHNSITQNVTTTPGSSYVISFWLAAYCSSGRLAFRFCQLGWLDHFLRLFYIAIRLHGVQVHRQCVEPRHGAAVPILFDIWQSLFPRRHQRDPSGRSRSGLDSFPARFGFIRYGGAAAQIDAVKVSIVAVNASRQPLLAH